MNETKMIKAIEEKDETQKEAIVSYIQTLYLNIPNKNYKKLLELKQN